MCTIILPDSIYPLHTTYIIYITTLTIICSVTTVKLIGKVQYVFISVRNISLDLKQGSGSLMSEVIVAQIGFLKKSSLFQQLKHILSTLLYI